MKVALALSAQIRLKGSKNPRLDDTWRCDSKPHPCPWMERSKARKINVSMTRGDVTQNHAFILGWKRQTANFTFPKGFHDFFEFPIFDDLVDGMRG